MKKIQITTSLDPNIIKKLKVYCAEDGKQMNKVIENAKYLCMTIKNDESWEEIAVCLPIGDEVCHQKRTGRRKDCGIIHSQLEIYFADPYSFLATWQQRKLQRSSTRVLSQENRPCFG